MNRRLNMANDEVPGRERFGRGGLLTQPGLVVALAFLLLESSAYSQETQELTPGPVVESDFEALKMASPFVRVLDPAEVFVLRGVAAINDIQVATLYNRETKKTTLVTPEKANEEGLQLVGVQSARTFPGEELTGVSARISFAGEEVELKFDAEQLSPQRKGGDHKGGSSQHRGGDDKRKGPSEEDRKRYHSLSEEKRGKLRQYIGHVMKSYPNMSRDERGNMIRGAMIRLSDGKDLDMPQPPSGGGQPQTPRPSGGGDRR